MLPDEDQKKINVEIWFKNFYKKVALIEKFLPHGVINKELQYLKLNSTKLDLKIKFNLPRIFWIILNQANLLNVNKLN